MSEDLIKEKLENHEKRIESLESKTSDIKTIIYRLDNVDKQINTMNNKFDNIENKLDFALKKDDEDKSKKWDKLVEYIFYAILGLLLGYIAYKLGIKNWGVRYEASINKFVKG